MNHEIYEVVSFEQVAPFTLSVRFNDGTSQVIDFRPILEGELYGPLRDESIFKQVRIDSEAHTLVWPNGADFDPTMLHNWPDSGPAMKALAQEWASAKPTAAANP